MVDDVWIHEKAPCVLESPTARRNRVLAKGEGRKEPVGSHTDIRQVIEEWVEACVKVRRHQWLSGGFFMVEMFPQARAGWAALWIGALAMLGRKYIEKQGQAWSTNSQEVMELAGEASSPQTQEMVGAAVNRISEEWGRYDEEGQPQGAGEEKPQWVEFWDDMTGEPLDSELVKRARAEVMKKSRKHSVYRKALVFECFEKAGREFAGWT